MAQRHICKKHLHRAGYLALALVYATLGVGWIDKTMAAFAAALIYGALAVLG